jgi:predicted RNase H-like nuclease (RuvC/YqgF family)
MSLLSLSPLLSSLFISYADRATALETAPATPSPESEEWKELQTTITALRAYNEKLKSEAREMVGKLEMAEASQEAFCSQISCLKEVDTTQQDDIKSLQAELVEAKDQHDLLMADSNVQVAALQVRVLDLEVKLEPLLARDKRIY